MIRRAPPAIILAGLVLGCSGEAEPPTAGEILRDGVDMVMIDMRTFVTREGIRRARLEADTAEFMGENEIHMRPVSLTFFDDQGAESTVITSDFGIFYENTEDMEAQGSVVILDREDDQRLETEKLRYIRAEDRLYGDVPFTLWSDGGRTRLEGTAFESDPGLDSFRVPSPSGSSERPPAPTAGVELETARQVPPADTLVGSGFETAARGAGDSAAVPPDSSDAPADSSPPPDTTRMPPDTTGTPPDTTGTPPDTTGTPPDTLSAPPDTTSVGGGRTATRRESSR